MEATSQSHSKVLMIGLSGPSSAGKTTLAHLLRHVFPSIVFIIHSDDFCKGFDDIPIVNGYLDADGPNGVDFIRLAKTLDYIKAYGKAPPDFVSWQADVFPGQDEEALKAVQPAELQNLSERVKTSGLDLSGRKLIIVDGFMLYNVEEVRKRLAVRLFIRLSHEMAKTRRMTRQGYGSEAKEGEFWKTEDYFEKMVWRNYVTEHAQFFKNGDVEGEPDEEKCIKAGIELQPALDVDVKTTLAWATDAIIRSLKSTLIISNGNGRP